jgi:hypothetical protein
MTMAALERRLTRLETPLTCDDDRLAWADVHQALVRQQARTRLTLCTRVGVDVQDPRVVEAMTWLVGDDPARMAQDVEFMARWPRQQGLTEDVGDVRSRLAPRLESLARRQREHGSAEGWRSARLARERTDREVWRAFQTVIAAA